MASMWSAFIFLVFIITKIECARILAYFPTPSISHQVVFRPITQALVKRGHEVIVVTTDPLPKGSAPANLTEIDVHDVSYKHWEELLANHRGEKDDVMRQMELLFEKIATVIKVQMDTPAVRKMLRNKDKKYFDILLLEGISRPLMGLGHIFDAPIIHIYSFGAFEYLVDLNGAQVQPFLFPTVLRQRSYNLTLCEKIMEIVKVVALGYKISRHIDFETNEMKKSFGDDVPSINKLLKSVQMTFVNEHPIWASNRPLPPNMLYIGGIHEGAHHDLPENLKNYLDSSKHGVIYVSFGTNVIPSLLPQQKIEIMSKVFAQLPYDVLWKWDKDTLPGQSNNIKISKWFPQSSLLKHPNIKLFITQGGLQSTDETITAAVPVIGVPMLGDQWYNTEKYVHHGIGLQLDITTLNETEFHHAVTTIINDKSYKNNILKLRTLMREFPIKPVDNAIWWIEHVIKHGGSHLRSPAFGLSWAEYYEIKLVMLILAILVIILLLLGYIFKFVFSLAFKFTYQIYVTDKKLKSM